MLIYLCPKCGRRALTVTIEDMARVVCGNCGLKDEIPIKNHPDDVDLYCLFVDRFLSHFLG